MIARTRSSDSAGWQSWPSSRRPSIRFTERLCTLACSLLSMPMAFVTVLDATRAHVKAHQGLAYVSLPRRDTFCDLTIRGDEPLIIPDLAADPRFCDNPLVVGDPGFRFYAGIPLALEPGVRLGALCVGDHVPRDLGSDQIECLQTLAGLVLGQIRHHATRRTLAPPGARADPQAEDSDADGAARRRRWLRA